MTYQFARERTDDSLYASGHVLHSAPGRTGFPVRLATELFQRSAARLAERGVQPPFTLYDPCCGAGLLLTTIGLLHGGSLGEIIGSDIDAAAVDLARRNLALLSPAGLTARIAELAALHLLSGRASYAAAAGDARQLLTRIETNDTASGRSGVPTSVFAADITRPGSLANLIAPSQVEMVITDVPYGNWSAWSSDPAEAPPGQSPIERMLETLRPVLAPGAVVTVVSGKDQRATHPAYRRMERWQLGRRRIEMVEIIPGTQLP